MINFLKQSRKFVNAKEAICIVLGNESCDLDSCTSALCLAYFLEQEHEKKSHWHIKAKQFLPVLNIPQRDYPIKTEVRYLLQKYDITEEMLTFRDELLDDFLERSEFVLVDHHVSPFAPQCVAVYDHRPKDQSITFPSDCFVNMDLVGSCATLVAETFLEKTIKNTDKEDNCAAYNLLRNTIVLDTVNFSPSAARFTAKDERMCASLECILKSEPHFEARNEIFEQLRKARADVSSLTASQLLRKDLKILRSSNGKNSIALPGLPLQVQQFIRKTDAEKALKDFTIENKCDLILLIGMFVRDDGGIERDIGLIIDEEKVELRNLIESKLLCSQDPPLALEACQNCNFMAGRFYKQNNIKATRKHIVPIIKQALEN